MPDFTHKAKFADARVIRATEKAILVAIDGAEYWIPQKCIDDESEIWKDGDEGELVVSQWIAEEKGLA